MSQDTHNEQAGAAYTGEVPLPPKDADVHTTACDYCIVGCGYKVFTWPTDSENGGPRAHENALGKDIPVGSLSGWVSENQHSKTFVDGEEHHVIVLPDPDTEVVNKGGDHSPRGGTLAQKLHHPDRQTDERLQQPQMRVDGELQDISWEDATRIVAEAGRHVIDEHGELAWGMKTFTYGYFENTYAITKLAYDAVETPMWSPHENASGGSTQQGFDDAGIDKFSAAYDDYGIADVIYVDGAEIIENKTILANQQIIPNGTDLIYVDPRKSPTAAYAEERTDGMHLQVEPGTDAILNNAIARYIIEQGWEDTEWIEEVGITSEELADENWRRRELGGTFEDFVEFIQSDDLYTLERAAEETGVSEEEMIAAAEMIAKPDEDGTRPKSTFMMEKGCYWNQHYPNSASVATLGLTCGAGGRPGRMISRGGGHQRGMITGGSYPMEKSPHEYNGHKIEADQDEWFVEGNLRFQWGIGVTWTDAMGGSQYLEQIIDERTLEVPEDQRITSTDPDEAIQALKNRADAGNLVLVQSDIYPNGLTENADIVFPASGWGENPLTRRQGEHRLRLYSEFADSPGNSRVDWQIVADVAEKMGYEGFDWADSNEVFEEAAEQTIGGRKDIYPVVEKAREERKTGHEKLGELGTEGITAPVKLEDGELVGTKRLHSKEEDDNLAPEGEHGFLTNSNKVVFPQGDFRMQEEFYERVKPEEPDEFWLNDGRENGSWQSMFDDQRIPFRDKRWPDQYVLMNEDDAAEIDVESGDRLRLWNDDVRTQDGGSYEAEIEGIAYVVEDEVPPGHLFGYFMFPGEPTNAFTHGDTDDLNNFYRYKLKSAKVEKLGESEYKETMTFSERNVM